MPKARPEGPPLRVFKGEKHPLEAPAPWTKTWKRPNEERGRSKKSALIRRTDDAHRWIASVDWLGLASDEVSLIGSTDERTIVPISTYGPAVLKKEKFMSTGSTAQASVECVGAIFQKVVRSSQGKNTLIGSTDDKHRCISTSCWS